MRIAVRIEERRSRLHLGDRREDEAHGPDDDDERDAHDGISPHARRPVPGHGTRLQRILTVGGGPSSIGFGGHARTRPETASGFARGRKSQQFSHHRAPKGKNNLSFSGIGGLAVGASASVDDARANRAATASTRTTRNATARRRRRVERCMDTGCGLQRGSVAADAAAADASDDSVRRAREACPRGARCGTPQFSHRARAVSKKNREPATFSSLGRTPR